MTQGARPGSSSDDSIVVGRLDHAGVTVADMDASLRFYRDTLGLHVVSDVVLTADYLRLALGVPFSTLRGVKLTIPGTMLTFLELLEYRGLKRRTSRPRPSDPTAGHLCLTVADARATFQALLAGGYRARSEAVVDIASGANAGGRFFYVADPDGYWIEILERAPIRSRA